MSSTVVPPGDRFEWFCEAVSGDLMPITIRAEHTAGFRAEIRSVGLGAVQVSSFAYSPVSASRSACHVRQGDPEQYQLALITDGAIRTAQLRNESVVSGDLVLTDTSRPMVNFSGCDGRPVRVVMLQVPRSELPLHPDRLDGLLARRIPAQRGTGAILARFMGTLLDLGAGCGPEELPGIGAVALDLATACLAQQLGAPEKAPAEARAQVMLQRIDRFIEHNLGDPALTPQAIADRHHISLRALYLLFRDQPASVAATIRQRRLERCHADLAHRGLGDQSVQVIAARWGFSNAGSFGRAFRAAYGITPSEHRAHALEA
ncbi:helix-turn-helix domain-containing protein [Kitasatospora sp. CM 4170]|uniref:Helix-turn-helix domain-containing protein n=1 Tax=Kitasatospora aburaviensis TaxID=67265 RepID=A0ABW1F3B7_9ACTN|nr:helix-turn-helix domain-containing protein [Kitasatospora sp. CM 4170]WNM49321.1 helix-turn-helix domain-containing protein [Kitasatospora sp. CM 4170]